MISIEEQITQVSQEHEKTCGVACFAMVTGLSYEDSLEKFPRAREEGVTLEDLYAQLYGIGAKPIKYATTCMPAERLFIISVPSINIPGGGHWLVADSRRGAERMIYDPNLGSHRRISYGYNDVSEVEIKTYFDVIEIPFTEYVG